MPAPAPATNSARSLLLSLVAFLALGGALAGGAYWLGGVEERADDRRAARPVVTGSRPADGATGVDPLDGVALDVFLPTTGAGVRADSLAGVTLSGPDGEAVAVRRNTTGSGDAIVVQPLEPLALGTAYTLTVPASVTDDAGQAFAPFAVSFTTAEDVDRRSMPVAFETVPLPTAELERDAFTALSFGPDGSLYAGTFSGQLYRFPVEADGTLGKPLVSTALLQAWRGPRMITGFAFEPGAEDPTLWVSHGQMVPPGETGEILGADNDTGAISVVSGAGLGQTRDAVVNLPRGYKDHLNFQPAFGPDGRLYFNQGSHTSAGSPDRKWGLRPEGPLTAATLMLDPVKLGDAPHPVDARGTSDALSVYATGIRSGYDLLWHSNGTLYTAVNGAAAGGATPAIPAADGRDLVPPIDDLDLTSDDVLLAVEPGRYYGHPNPARGEFTLLGGNPTAGVDPQEVPQYPVGTPPSEAYTPPAFTFGKNLSPNGLVEWTADRFSEELGGAILVTRYSAGDDVQVLIPDGSGRITASLTNLVGLRRFTDPLDLTLDPSTGNLYVAEYGGRRITLVRPTDGVSDDVRHVPR